MKIVFISPVYYPTPWGGALALRLLAEGLAESGHEVTVFAFDGNEVSEEKSISGVKLVRYQRNKNLANIVPSPKLIPQVISVIRQSQKNADLFHISNLSPLVGAGIYRIFGGRKPIVATFDSYGAFCPLSHAMCPHDNCSFIQRSKCLAGGRGMGQRILAISYAAIYPLLISVMKRADGYIAPSQAVKQMYVRHGYDKDKISVIPHFMVMEEQAGLSDSKVAKKRGVFNILYAGQLLGYKGVDILVQAFSKLAKGNPDVQLTIVGDGPLKEALEMLVKQLQIDEQVFFTGFVPHESIGQYYKAADVFVHPAIWSEPFGLTILEAMRFHLPLIVSNIGGPSEIVGDAGLVFEKGNVGDLAQRLKLVYEDQKLRQELSSNCSRVLQNYDRDKIIARIETFYQQVVSGN